MAQLDYTAHFISISIMDNTWRQALFLYNLSRGSKGAELRWLGDVKTVQTSKWSFYKNMAFLKRQATGNRNHIFDYFTQQK